MPDGWGGMSTGRYHVRIAETGGDVQPLDALHSALALLGRTSEDSLFFPVTSADIPATRVMTAAAIDRIKSDSRLDHARHVSFSIYFSSSSSGGTHWDDFLWRIFSAMLLNPTATRAAHYLRSAFKDVHLLAGPVDDDYSEFEDMPSQIVEQVQIETSIQDCLKTIETLNGGPLTRDTPRIARKLETFGIAAGEHCGFSRPQYRQERIIDKVVRLRDARDRRAAHGGRTSEARRNSLYELCDFQHLAKTVLWRYLFRDDPDARKGEPLTLPLALDRHVLELGETGAYATRRRIGKR